MHRALCLLLLLTPPALADILIEGTRGIEHELVFEGLEAFPGIRFALYPAGFGDEAHEVEPGQSVYFKFGEPRLFAIQGEIPPEGAQQAFFANEALPRSAAQVTRTNVVDESDRRGKIRTVYRVERIEGNRIDLSVEEWTFDRAGAELQHVARHPAPPDDGAHDGEPDVVTYSLDPDTLELSTEEPSTQEPEPGAAAPSPAATSSPGAASGGGLCALRAAGAAPLLGLSALALVALLLVRLRRSA